MIYDIFIEITRDASITTFDQAWAVMQGKMPQLNRQDVVDAINAYVRANSTKATEDSKRMAKVRREPLLEQNTQDMIDSLIAHLNNDTLPPVKKVQRENRLTLAHLRAIRLDLMRDLKNSEPALKKRIDSALSHLEEKLEREIKVLEKHLEDGTDPIPKKQKREDRLGVAELKAIKQDIRLSLKNTPAKLEAKAAAKAKKERERIQAAWNKFEADIEETISGLRQHLEDGTMPYDLKNADEEIARQRSDSLAKAELKAIREDVRRAVNRSDAAVRDRLEMALEVLDRRIETEDVFPKQMDIKPKSEEVEWLEFKLGLRRDRIRAMQLDLKPPGTLYDKFWKVYDTVFDGLRATYATGEWSFVLRQGGAYAFAHPIRALQMQPKMIGAFFSQKDFYTINQEILNNPDAPAMKKAGLHFGALDNLTDGTNQEEQLMGTILDKVPLVNKAAHGFDRAAVTYLNMIRADSYRMMTNNGTIGGKATEQEAKDIAFFINVSTGRGSLGDFQQGARVMSRVIFSPRYVASRLQLFLGIPFFRANGRAKTIIMQEYVRTMLGAATALGLAELFRRSIDDPDEFDIEWDARSSDFAKLRFGNRRIDLLAGVGQFAVLAARVSRGETKSIGSGRIKKTRGKDVKWGQKFSSDLIKDFILYKGSPFSRVTLALLDGKTFDGPLTYENAMQWKNIPLPITYRDVLAAFKQEGVDVNIAISLMAFYGVGLQVYED